MKAKTEYAVSTRARLVRSTIDSPRAVATMQARSAVWVRMSIAVTLTLIPCRPGWLRPDGRPFTLRRRLACHAVLLPLVALLLAAPPESSSGRPRRPRPGRRAGARRRATSRRSGIRRFPPGRRPVPAPAPAARRFELRRLDPVFTGTLAAPRAEFEAGRYERTVQLLATAEGHAAGPLPARPRPAEGAPHRRRRRGAGGARHRAARHRRSLPARGSARARGAR